MRHRLVESRANEEPGQEIMSLVKGIVAPAEKLAHPPLVRSMRATPSYHPWILAAASAAALFLVVFLLLGETSNDRSESTRAKSTGNEKAVEKITATPLPALPPRRTETPEPAK
ncbi:MAG: hypothetical protein ACYTFG_10995, partial [Planctomycetota bacterium]